MSSSSTADTADAGGAASNTNNGNNRQKPKASEEKIRVAVRIRPLNPREASSSEHGAVWKANESNEIVQTNVDGTHEAGHDVYAFGRTFDERSTTRQVYDGIGKSIVSDVVRGYHGTICAYGQTSSGKTFTMQGGGNDEGIVHMAARDIFGRIDLESTRAFGVSVSFIEIYNEDVRDLLASGKDSSSLAVREDRTRGFFVNSTEKNVTSVNELLRVLLEGQKNRSVEATKMNDQSSRSHTVFRINMESRPKDGQNDFGSDAVNNSTLNLVDLAGSESVKHTGATGDRQREGGKINQSLLSLSLVIKNLAHNAKNKGQIHVDYRGSNLTKILKPSLSGKMAIICCATPSGMYLEETRSTLQFANRAQMIKTEAKKSRRRLTEGAVGHNRRRTSIAQTPLRKMAKKLFSPGKPRSAMKRYPQTDVKLGRARQRPSILATSSTIPEHDEAGQAARDIVRRKDAKIAGLEAELKSTANQLQSTTDKLQKCDKDIEWLRLENRELRSQVFSLVADKEFLDMEREVESNHDDLGTNHDRIVPSPYIEEGSSSRRESNDSNATEEYIIPDEMQHSSIDSYDGVVRALENSYTRVYELERLVARLQDDNEELKRNSRSLETLGRVSVMNSEADKERDHKRAGCDDGEPSNPETVGHEVFRKSNVKELVIHYDDKCRANEELCNTGATLYNGHGQDVLDSSISGSLASGKYPRRDKSRSVPISDENSSPKSPKGETWSFSNEMISSKQHTTPAKRGHSNVKRTPLGKATIQNIPSSGRKITRARSRRKTNRYTPSW